MKPEIKLFFDFEFTSLSPDVQPISLGIVSEELIEGNEAEIINELLDSGSVVKALNKASKSFYSEFSDFDLNRCDDWVKENVLSKLKYYGTPKQDRMFIDSSIDEGTIFGSQNTAEIKGALHKWLTQFSGYNIQFVCDCGTFDFYWMLQLLAEWKTYNIEEKQCNKCGWIDEGGYNTNFTYKSGLPKLPENISPVPQDLNDLIALKKGISVKEAFDWNRLQFYFGIISGHSDSKKYEQAEIEIKNNHNALFDAKVIKAIYEKLK